MNESEMASIYLGRYFKLMRIKKKTKRVDLLANMLLVRALIVSLEKIKKLENGR